MILRGLMAASGLSTEEESAGWRHFDIADGFALALIGILLLVLAGVAAMAWVFRKRERQPPPGVQALADAEVEEHDFAPGPKHSPEREHSWEREADWWKRNPRR